MMRTPRALFEEIHLPLQTWLLQNGISYPWGPHFQDLTLRDRRIELPRTLPDPYAVWISEIMLQQTRTATVRDFFSRWMAAWPDLNLLAEASEAEVLKNWEGLGYYSRASNILQTAKRLAAEKHTFPPQAADLRKLPGIGSYTAAAIASLSFNEPVLALDTNVKRIFSRLYQVQPEEQLSSWQARHSEALSFLPWRGSGNIALIQLGQQRCTAKAPLCSECPLAELCPGAARKNWELFPRVRPKEIQKIETRRLLLKSAGKTLYVRNTGRLLQKLWRLPSPADLKHLGTGEILPADLEENAEYLGTFQHHYLSTREKISVYTVEPAAARKLHNLSRISYVSEADRSSRPEFAWLSAEEEQRVTMPGPYRKFLLDWQQSLFAQSS